MSEPDDHRENFLRRWSRRKQAVDASTRKGGALSDPATAESDAMPAAPPQSAPTPAAFDPASLPPLQSIGAATDIRPFLMPGVPEELKRAALRRAWLTDPAIRNFIGIAENQWDFTQADGVPGFGPLELTEELRRMASRLVGETPEPTPSRPDPDRDLSDQDAEKPMELPKAAAPQATSAPAAESGIDLAPGEPEASGEAVSGASPVADEADSAVQPKPEGTIARASIRPRHGGAVPE